MATPILGGVTLTGNSVITVEKTANIIPLPVPSLDSDQTEVFDLLGVIKLIGVEGIFSGGSTAATKALIDSVEALIDGNQTSTVTFTSDQTGTITVKVASITSTWELPGFAANYNIRLIQGK